MELLRASSTLATVGSMEASESSEALTAIMNGFKLETEDAMEVVDKLSHLDLIAATSSEELAVALQRVSAYADSAGVSIDKMLAYITTVSSVTRLSAETIGNGWKSIFSRMQNVKASKQFDDYGEAILYMYGRIQK